METLKQILEMVIFAVLTGCGVAVVVKLLNIANAKIDELQTNTALGQYTQLNKYIDAAQEVIYNSVVSVSQTYVDSLKKEGKFDKEAQEVAKNQATEIANQLITKEMIEAIEMLRGDANAYINNMIEQAVKDTKIK